MGFFSVATIIAAIFGLVCIRIPRIYLYDEYFEIEKKCVINKFTDRDIFYYKNLAEIKFSESYTDWLHIIVTAIFGSGGYGGNSKADQMIVKTKDNDEYFFNRFGSRKKFIHTIDLIKKHSIIRS